MSASNPDQFTMIPADTASTPEDDLAAAAAGAVAAPASVQPVTTDPPIPFGTSWVFDFQVGQFVWQGSSPQVTTTEFGGLIQWCLMAIYSARYAHAVFSDNFGMEGLDDPIGQIPATELLADWQANMTEALLVHDRITSIENVSLDWDPQTGILTILTLDVVTDEDDKTAQLNGVQVQIGATS